jgi:hypothetical protein
VPTSIDRPRAAVRACRFPERQRDGSGCSVRFASGCDAGNLYFWNSDMISLLRRALCAAALAWFASGCGAGGGDAGNSAKDKPVFKPRPGEAEKREFVEKLLQKKGMMPKTTGTKEAKK